MSDFPERNLNQTAVYWAAPVNDGYGGFTYDDPVEIDCRWVDSTRVIMTDKGSEVVCRAEVQVSTDLVEEGMLLLGTVNDLDSDVLTDPLAAGASKIIRFDKIPTIKSDKFFRKAYL